MPPPQEIEFPDQGVRLLNGGGKNGGKMKFGRQFVE
jgi:hypothetical protein